MPVKIITLAIFFIIIIHSCLIICFTKQLGLFSIIMHFFVLDGNMAVYVGYWWCSLAGMEFERNKYKRYEIYFIFQVGHPDSKLEYADCISSRLVRHSPKGGVLGMTSWIWWWGISLGDVVSFSLDCHYYPILSKPECQNLFGSHLIVE